ncbi:hypothetical protein VNO80_03271 [Phaseolus coccineus]|uniref:Uncharacterized protein n=1 Tax=Phaseolus coccineus TaxID=3886 RepID=A0AAN9RRN7_PHACN
MADRGSNFASRTHRVQFRCCVFSGNPRVVVPIILELFSDVRSSSSLTIFARAVLRAQDSNLRTLIHSSRDVAQLEREVTPHVNGPNIRILGIHKVAQEYQTPSAANTLSMMANHMAPQEEIIAVHG